MTTLTSSTDLLNKEKLPFAAWLMVGLLCVVGCLNYLDRVMVTTMRESIISSVPMTDAQFGLLAAFLIFGGLGIYASGALRDADIDLSLLFKLASFTMIVCAGLLYLVKKDVEKSGSESGR